MQAGVCVTLLLCGVVTCLGYEAVNSTQIKIENNSGQRDYHEQEEGKVLPFRFDKFTINFIFLSEILINYANYQTKTQCSFSNESIINLRFLKNENGLD